MIGGVDKARYTEEGGMVELLIHPTGRKDGNRSSSSVDHVSAIPMDEARYTEEGGVAELVDTCDRWHQHTTGRQ